MGVPVKLCGSFEKQAIRCVKAISFISCHNFFIAFPDSLDDVYNQLSLLGANYFEVMLHIFVITLI